MSQTLQLVEALKRLLKARGLTYAQLAEHLGLSEASVKRQFSQASLRLRTLEAICERAQIDFAELARNAEDAQAEVRQLDEAQEADLVADPRRLLVAVCVLNQMSFEQIVAQYRLTKAECVAQLLRLDRLGLIRVLPENRVKLRISRDFHWLPDGPIQRFFRSRAQTEFLDARFGHAGELYRFQHGMLTRAANLRIQQRLVRVQQEFAELHRDSTSAPMEERFGTSLLMAMRPWELPAFEDLRRLPDARAFLTEGGEAAATGRRAAAPPKPGARRRRRS
jgi:transcriptional regulator with XRE-family HTH domain